MTYLTIRFLHSLLRWVILSAGGLAILQAVLGLKRKQPYTASQVSIGKLFVASLHVNLVLGVLLYMMSPVTSLVFSNMGAVMKNGGLRFFAVEHVFGMLAAIVVATVGSVRIKKTEGARSKHKRALVYFGLAFVILIISIPWPFYPAGRPLLFLP